MRQKLNNSEKTFVRVFRCFILHKNCKQIFNILILSVSRINYKMLNLNKQLFGSEILKTL